MSCERGGSSLALCPFVLVRTPDKNNTLMFAAEIQQTTATSTTAAISTTAATTAVTYTTAATTVATSITAVTTATSTTAATPANSTTAATTDQVKILSTKMYFFIFFITG